MGFRLPGIRRSSFSASQSSSKQEEAPNEVRGDHNHMDYYLQKTEIEKFNFHSTAFLLPVGSNMYYYLLTADQAFDKGSTLLPNIYEPTIHYLP
ncbi:hypothetical protein MTR_2g012400 [Medicago truncatula]|uniref:Uncharacterized protein n=1 Tax=Medicago truncatula TaxID=3880 RepID=G7ILE8_MEDTR|nr:hypothetical protein MTR_2g012400 [Medicago truncatula]